MEDIKTLMTLAGEFKSEIDLQKYCDQQFIALHKAAKHIKQLQEEVEQLKTLLTSTTQLIGESNIEKIIITPEEALCDTQIDILRQKGMQVELTLEDTKKLDLLIKNKRLIKEQCTTIISDKKSEKKISNAELLKIAAKVTSDDPKL